jgi:predicted nucleic acid-binding protein
MGEISESQANVIENTFNADSNAGLYLQKSLETTCYKQAEKWLSARKTSMRTLDALHLACSIKSQAIMVTCDVVLHKSAEIFGVPSLLIK